MSSRKQATKPRPSATVVLLRDSANGPEVLLVLRHERAAFGASYVFPGGVNEPGDAEVHERCHRLTDAVASKRLGVADAGLNYYVAAIRELFEETGILLAHCAREDGARVQVTEKECVAQRALLNNGELRWEDFLAERDLSLACDTLRYFAFWVTPRVFSKRFSTRFFMAPAPAGQQACHDGNELTDSCWMRPADALALAADDTLTLPPPTRATLKDLSRFRSVQDALAWAKACELEGIGCTLPAMLGPRDDQRIVLPGSPDYPDDHRGLQA